MMTLRQRIAQAIAEPFPYAGLTDRERQALHLASRGLPPGEIQAALGLPERTSYRAFESGLRKLSDHFGRTIPHHDLPGRLIEKLKSWTGQRWVVSLSKRPGEPTLAEQEQVDVRTYRVIYRAIEDVRDALVGLLEPDIVEDVIGQLEVRIGGGGHFRVSFA